MAVVRGVLLNRLQQPEPGVRLLAINFEKDCSGPGLSGPFGTAQTNSSGEFAMEMTLIFMGPGTYCFDLVASKNQAVDTIKVFGVPAVEQFPPKDTTVLTLTAGW
jgi:hypothetical protein